MAKFAESGKRTDVAMTTVERRVVVRYGEVMV